ncbi:MAG: Spy/CpxP family protein refolding chaperone [Nitrospiraceae bacterium]
MKHRILTGGLAVVMLLGLGAQAAWADEEAGYRKGHEAGPSMGSHRMGGHQGSTGHYLRHLLRHQKEIGLTDDQVTKLKTIQLELDRTRIKTEADIQVAERELVALLEDEKANLAAIEAKVKQSESLQVGLRMTAIKAKREAVALLTPEQREREKAEHEKMMQPHRSSEMGSGMSGGMMGGSMGHGEPSKAQPKQGDGKK